MTAFIFINIICIRYKQQTLTLIIYTNYFTLVNTVIHPKFQKSIY